MRIVGGETERTLGLRVRRQRDIAADPRQLNGSGRADRGGCGGEKREAKTAERDDRTEEGAQKIVAEVTRPPFSAQRRGSWPS